MRDSAARSKSMKTAADWCPRGSQPYFFRVNVDIHRLNNWELISCNIHTHLSQENSLTSGSRVTRISVVAFWSTVVQTGHLCSTMIGICVCPMGG